MVQTTRPLGVVTVITSSTIASPLVAMCTAVAAALSSGCTLVVALDGQSASSVVAMMLHKVLDTSDVPAGVVNLLTGDVDHLTRQFADHHVSRF